MNTLRFHFALLAIGLFLTFNAPPLKAQSPLDGFDPNTNGRVNDIVVQPDGKIIIGGGFTTVSPNGGAPVTRKCIARFNPDGTLDTAFNAGSIVFAVFTVALQTDGKILIGGGFTSIGGQPRNNIARLDAVTGQPDSFNPNASNEVLGIALQADGKILVIGYFTNIGGQARAYIARLDPTTGLADSFNPGADYYIYAIAIQTDGKILVSGIFTGIGGQSRNRIARLDKDTGLADSFNPNATSTYYPFSAVNAIAIQPDGKILIGGEFTHIGGQARNYIARLDKDTGQVDSFNPSGFSVVYAITVQTDGKILVSGRFAVVGTQIRYYLTRLYKDTGLADSFSPGVNNYIYTIAVQTDGKILAGGEFTTVFPNGGAPVTRNRIVRFLPAPTAAQVSVSGRVFTADGSGLRNASVMLTGANGNFRTASTGSFGYFRFDAVQAGETYIVSIISKGHQFAPQAVTVNEELSELSFTALE